MNYELLYKKLKNKIISSYNSVDITLDEVLTYKLLVDYIKEIERFKDYQFFD